MVVIPIYVRVCTGTNDCRRVNASRGRGRGRGSGRSSGRARARTRSSGRYAAVGGLRHLLHELTVVGVAAARYANLQAREAHLVDENESFMQSLARAAKHEETAATRLAQLQAQRAALQRGEESVEAKTLTNQINEAKTAHELAAGRVNKYENLRDGRCQELDHVRSQIAAMQGALLACVPPCHVVPTPSRLLRPPLAIILLPPLRARPAQGMACCVQARSSRLCCVALRGTPTDS